MGKVVKKVVKGVTGIDLDAKKKAEEEARRQQQEAEEAARRQAELEAAQNAATNVGEQGEAQAETPEATTTSDVKKRIKGGRKSLTVARVGGSGINI